MQQKPAWKAPPCVCLSVHTHPLWKPTLVLNQQRSRHSSTLAYEYSYFFPLVIHKVPTITLNQCDNKRLKKNSSQVMPTSLLHLEQVMTHHSYNDQTAPLGVCRPSQEQLTCIQWQDCDSSHLLSQQPSRTVINVATAKRWNMMNEGSHFFFQSTDLQRPPSSTGMRKNKKGAGLWERLVIFQLWLHCRYHMLYCCKMTVFLTLTACLSLGSSPLFSLSLFGHTKAH